MNETNGRATDGAASLVVVDVDINALIDGPYNPRAMTEKEAGDLKASITRFGIVEPIIVNQFPGRENIIVGGHQRRNVCRDLLGYTTMPVVYVSLPEDKERELNLRLNRNLGHWDWDMLANHFDLPFLVEVGFHEDELRARFQLDSGWADAFDNAAGDAHPNKAKFQLTLTFPAEMRDAVRAAIDKAGSAEDVFTAGMKACAPS